MKSKKRTIIGNICKVVGFLLIFVLLFSLFVKIFSFKYTKTVATFYKLPEDSVDVLFVGSSHAYHNVDPNVLYEESGTTAYIMGSASQMVWSSYYLMKEACKTQHPKVVFLECYKTYFTDEYSDEPTALKAFCNMKFSRNYLDNVFANFGDKEKRIDSALLFPWYHSRYTDLKGEDFKPNYGNEYYANYLGYSPMKKSVKSEIPEGIGEITERAPLSDKVVTYLDKCVELSKEEGFELVFLLTPYCEEAVPRQAYYNTLADYADEKGITLINGNLLYDELGLIGDKDFGNGNHLCHKGARKMTLYLNDFLNQNFDLQDHRGDAYYQRWENNRLYMQEHYPIKTKTTGGK